MNNINLASKCTELTLQEACDRYANTNMRGAEHAFAFASIAHLVRELAQLPGAEGVLNRWITWKEGRLQAK
jgi:hypothetical protein